MKSRTAQQELLELTAQDKEIAADIAAKRSQIELIAPGYFERSQLFPSRSKDEPAILSAAKIQGGPTGPRTPEGKAVSSMNALRTGLTGRTVLLSSDDADAYAAHIEQYRAEYSPAGLRETELVQSLADTSWRLRRIPGLEMALYAQGRCEFANAFDHHDAALRPAMIELQTHLKYEKQLRNLQLQESRLHRRYTNEMAELRDLQKERVAREAQTQATAPRSTTSAAPAPREFEFSTAPTQPDRAAQTAAATSCDLPLSLKDAA